MAKFGKADVAYVDSAEGEPAYDAVSFQTLDAQLWTPQGAIGARPGRRPGSGLALQVLSSPEGVRVTPGAVSISAGDGRGQYYREVFENAEDFTSIGRPGSGTVRHDRFIARWNPTTKEGVIERVVGTAGAAPDPAATQPPGGTIFEDLGYATVPATGAGAITVTPSTRRTVAVGGVLPVTQAERNALVAAGNVWPGMTVFNTTQMRQQTYLGNSRWTGDLITYTPYYGQSDGTALGIGGGSHVGSYIRGDDGYTDFTTVLTRSSNSGTATATGTGGYYVGKTPTTPADTFGISGNGMVRRFGTNPDPALREYPLTINGVTGDQFSLVVAGAPGVRIGPGYYAWGLGDQIIVNGRYREAV